MNDSEAKEMLVSITDKAKYIVINSIAPLDKIEEVEVIETDGVFYVSLKSEDGLVQGFGIENGESFARRVKCLVGYIITIAEGIEIFG